MENKIISGTLAPAIAKAPVIYGMRDGLPVEKGIGMTDSFLERNFDLLCQYADLWIAYPDLFIDLITPIDSNFKLYFYQRMFMRVAIRPWLIPSPLLVAKPFFLSSLCICAVSFCHEANSSFAPTSCARP